MEYLIFKFSNIFKYFKVDLFGHYLEFVSGILLQAEGFKSSNYHCVCPLQAMAKDPKNYYQDTWKQIRNKIKLFTDDPYYYIPYLKKRGHLDSNKKQSKGE